MSNADRTASRSLYVYYRVPTGHEAQARQAVEAMQTRLSDAHPGLRTRLMCRADGQPLTGEQTWMEVYEHPDGVSMACEALLNAWAGALPAGLIGARHVEVFESLHDK